MSVYLAAGIPGAGKSLYAIQEWIIPALKKGRKVYTNIDGLSHDRIAAIFDMSPMDVNLKLFTWEPTDIQKIRQFYTDVEIGALVVIDEAQNYFGSRDWDTKEAKDLIPWLTKQRHLGVDVLFITQSVDSVDITIRRLAALTYLLKRMEHLGFDLKTLVYIYDRCNLERKHFATKIFSFNKAIFMCYSSYDSSTIVEERKKVNPLLRSWGFWALMLISAFGIYSLFSGGGLAAKIAHKKPKSEKVNTESVPVSNGVHPDETGNALNNNDCYVSYKYINGQSMYIKKDGYITYEKINKCSN